MSEKPGDRFAVLRDIDRFTGETTRRVERLLRMSSLVREDEWREALMMVERVHALARDEMDLMVREAKAARAR